VADGDLSNSHGDCGGDRSAGETVRAGHDSRVGCARSLASLDSILQHRVGAGDAPDPIVHKPK
jgi:hypothetical protein